MNAVKHEFKKPPNGGFTTPHSFENKYDQVSASFNITQDEYDSCIDTLSDVQQINVKSISHNFLRTSVTFTIASLIIMTLSLSLQANGYIVTNHNDKTLNIVYLVCTILLGVVVLGYIIFIPLELWRLFRTHKKLKQEGQVTLLKAVETENLKYRSRGFSIYLAYPEEKKGSFAFIHNWNPMPALVISEGDIEQQQETYHQDNAENAPVIYNDAYQSSEYN